MSHLRRPVPLPVEVDNRSCSSPSPQVGPKPWRQDSGFQRVGRYILRARRPAGRSEQKEIVKGGDTYRNILSRPSSLCRSLLSSTPPSAWNNHTEIGQTPLSSKPAAACEWILQHLDGCVTSPPALRRSHLLIAAAARTNAQAGKGASLCRNPFMSRAPQRRMQTSTPPAIEVAQPMRTTHP